MDIVNSRVPPAVSKGPSFSIAQALTGILIGAFGIFGIIFSIYMESALESNFGEIQKKDFQRRIENHAITLHHFIEVHGRLVEDLSTDPIIIQSVANTESMGSKLIEHMNRIRILGKEVQVVLLNNQGELIHASSPLPEFNYQKELWVKDVVSKKIKNHFSIHRNWQGYFFTFSSAVIDNDGQSRGILLTEIPATALTSIYHWSDQGGQEQLQIFEHHREGGRSSDSMMLLTHDHSSYENSKTPSTLFHFNEGHHHDHHHSSNTADEHAELIISLGPDLPNRPHSSIYLPEYKLQLVGYLDNSNLIDASIKILEDLIVVIILLALAAIAAIFCLSRKLFIEPISTLRDATNLIASGEFLHSQAATKSLISSTHQLGEIRALSNDVTSMAKIIDAREKALQEVNNTLEQRVLERTRELQAAHDAALSASRAKSGFLATMSHEIRTPMNAVLGILGLLRDTPLNKDQRKLVRTGRESGELLLSIINDILDFSKMEADKLQLESSGFDLHQLLKYTIELLRPQADRKGLVLELQLAPDLPSCAKGDPDRLRQILINLVNNAIKFTSSGQVTINASTNHQTKKSFYLSCAVHDTGVGIPEEFQSTLFDEFTMADQSYSRSHEGTGLGLAICQRLVAMMKGNISFQSKLGVGSTFVFNVELEKINRNECKVDFKPILSTNPTALSNIRILLAEDNPANQMVIKSILERSDLQVDIVANGKEAVEAVSNLPYDIVLMDISMPEMDGMEATRNIRQTIGKTGKIPIIALTAHALPGDKERFLEAGMNDYLNKPIDRQATLQCIARWTRTPGSPATVTDKPEKIVENAQDYVAESTLQQLVRDTAAEIVPELIELYIQDARQRIEKIQDALSKSDTKALEFETHTLGSSALAHGNTKLHTIARQIECLCHDGSHTQALAKSPKLIIVANKSLDQLAQRAGKGFR